jgi:drug/metabolite transporter (DMT)-like permease
MFSQRLRADLALGLCALVWGSTFVVVKDALSDSSVFVYIALRFGLAASLLAILFRHSVYRLTIGGVWAGVQIGLFMFGGFAFQTAGLKFTTPSKAAFITGSSVVFVPLLLAAFGRRRISPWIWIGAISTLLGLYFLTIPSQGLSAFNGGDLLVFVCSVMFALHLISVARYVQRHSVGALAFVQVATTATLSILLLPVFALTGWEQPHLVWTKNVVFSLLVTSVGSTVIGFTLQIWAQQHTSPSHTAILISLEPVFAALTSWLLAREHLGPRTLLGAAFVFLGILFAELRGPAPAVPESPEPSPINP